MLVTCEKSNNFLRWHKITKFRRRRSIFEVSMGSGKLKISQISIKVSNFTKQQSFPQHNHYQRKFDDSFEVCIIHFLKCIVMTPSFPNECNLIQVMTKTFSSSISHNFRVRFWAQKNSICEWNDKEKEKIPCSNTSLNDQLFRLECKRLRPHFKRYFLLMRCTQSVVHSRYHHYYFHSFPLALRIH